MNAAAIADAVRKGSLTAHAAVSASLERIAATEPRINAFTAVLAELHRGPLTLVGYSWGAMLAALYCIESAAGRAGAMPVRPTVAITTRSTFAERSTIASTGCPRTTSASR